MKLKRNINVNIFLGSRSSKTLWWEFEENNKVLGGEKENSKSHIPASYV